MLHVYTGHTWKPCWTAQQVLKAHQTFLRSRQKRDAGADNFMTDEERAVADMSNDVTLKAAAVYALHGTEWRTAIGLPVVSGPAKAKVAAAPPARGEEASRLLRSAERALLRQEVARALGYTRDGAEWLAYHEAYGHASLEDTAGCETCMKRIRAASDTSQLAERLQTSVTAAAAEPITCCWCGGFARRADDGGYICHASGYYFPSLTDMSKNDPQHVHDRMLRDNRGAAAQNHGWLPGVDSIPVDSLKQYPLLRQIRPEIALADFYVILHAELMLNPGTTHSSKMAVLERARSRVVPSLVQAFYDYIAIAVFAEMRYAGQNCTHYYPSIPYMDTSRESVQRLALQYEPTSIIQAAARLFDCRWGKNHGMDGDGEHAGGVGGKSWARIAHAGLKRTSGGSQAGQSLGQRLYGKPAAPPVTMSDSAWIDVVVDLSHNNGLYLNKGAVFYAPHSSTYLHLLDAKRYGNAHDLFRNLHPTAFRYGVPVSSDVAPLLRWLLGTDVKFDIPTTTPWHYTPLPWKGKAFDDPLTCTTFAVPEFEEEESDEDPDDSYPEPSPDVVEPDNAPQEVLADGPEAEMEELVSA